jgi:hypothetical protein
MRFRCRQTLVRLSIFGVGQPKNGTRPIRRCRLLVREAFRDLHDNPFARNRIPLCTPVGSLVSENDLLRDGSAKGGRIEKLGASFFLREGVAIDCLKRPLFVCNGNCYATQREYI